MGSRVARRVNRTDPPCNQKTLDRVERRINFANGEYVVIRLRVTNVGHDAPDISATSRTGTILFVDPAHTSPSKYELEVYGNGGTEPTYIRL